MFQSWKKQLPADINMFLGADTVDELHELSQPTEEGVLVGSGGMKARLLNVQMSIADTR